VSLAKHTRIETYHQHRLKRSILREQVGENRSRQKGTRATYGDTQLNQSESVCTIKSGTALPRSPVNECEVELS